MLVKRAAYVERLSRKKWNGQIKVITGVRRCGKSTLLTTLYRDELVRGGVSPEDIISIPLDSVENVRFHDPFELYSHINSVCGDPGRKYYLFLDEIQYAISSEELRNKDNPTRLYLVLNSLVKRNNIDVYVTGSNSKLLSTDIMTEFRGRGDVLKVYPFTFSEFLEGSGMDAAEGYKTYERYGGMPFTLTISDDDDKESYLANLSDEILLKDIIERYDIKKPDLMRRLLLVLDSSAGSLTSSTKLANTITSMGLGKIDPDTVSLYLGYIRDSMRHSMALRFDLKGKKYLKYPVKFYPADVGLRNAALGMRQVESPHIMENIIHNELLARGCQVDVGVVRTQGKDRTQVSAEIDFIARRGSNIWYIQSAWRMEDEDKKETELRPLRAIRDSFRKIVVSPTYGRCWVDDDGIFRIGLTEFLLNPDSLTMWP